MLKNIHSKQDFLVKKNLQTGKAIIFATAVPYGKKSLTLFLFSGSEEKRLCQTFSRVRRTKKGQSDVRFKNEERNSFHRLPFA